MRISEFWIHVADRLWELVAFGGLTACLTLSECPPKHSAHLLGHEMGYAGADPGFFSGGGALVSCSTSTPIDHIVFFLAEYQLY